MADNNKYPPNHQEHLKEWFDKERKIPLKERYKNYPKHIDVESIINPPKKKYKRGMCVVCLKTLENAIQIENMMCDNCEETTTKIANEFNVLDRFDIVENKDRKRWEFDPKGNWIGYTVSFFECETKEDAIIAIWKALKMQSD